MLIFLSVWVSFWITMWLGFNLMQHKLLSPIILMFGWRSAYVGVFYDVSMLRVYFFPLPFMGWVYCLKK